MLIDFLKMSARKQIMSSVPYPMSFLFCCSYWIKYQKLESAVQILLTTGFNFFVIISFLL